MWWNLSRIYISTLNYNGQSNVVEEGKLRERALDFILFYFFQFRMEEAHSENIEYANLS